MTETTILERYESLPEWLRWILCWPISAFFSLVFGWLLLLTAGREAFEEVVRLSHPVIIQVLFLGAIFFTVPRAKLAFVVAFIVLRSVFLLMFAVVTPLVLLEIVPKPDDLVLDWQSWWRPFLGEVLTLAASIATFRTLREVQPPHKAHVGKASPEGSASRESF